MRFLRSKRGMAAVAAILLILFLFRPGVYRLRNRIAGSISSALGRRVELDNVRIHLVPRPGFDLEELVIYDDPAFSSEPMVRAQDVSASIRLRSLLRGRLEIARLSATEPSINLVRNPEGRWNLANLLERNAHIPAAPTGKGPSEPRPGFPYLEAVHARINFKLGQEKKPLALTDADVTLWQESENSWGARIKAQPVRTDFNLTDTGLLELNATWQRAADLRTTPVQVTALWEKGQLGQITKLLSGKDHGWRGGVNIAANLSGTPEALTVRSQIRVTEFHRYDIVESAGGRLSANCAGRYSVSDGVLAGLRCESPLSSGTLAMTGSLGPSSNGLSYDLRLAASKVPLTSVLRLLRQAKKQLPPDLTATGVLNADLHAVRKGTAPAEINGEGTAANVRLSANAGKDEIAFGTVPLRVVSAQDPSSRKAPTSDELERTGSHLRVGAFPLALGGSAQATAGGWATLSGYRLYLRGDVAIKNLYRLANTIGLGGSRPGAEGLARLDVSVSGLWQGFAAPIVTGTAQLRSARAEMRGMNAPIEIASALVTLTPDSASIEKLSAQTGTTHWTGGITAPRPCLAPGCVFRFDLAADQLSAADLDDWFTTHAAKRPWYRILNLDDPAGASPLLAARASGNLRVGRLEIKKILVTQISTWLDLSGGKITLTNLRGQLLQGTHQGNWTVDVSAQPMKYQAAGTVQNISLPQVSALMNDSWMTGTVDTTFEGTASGSSFAELLANANAKFQFVVRNGSLPRVDSLGSAGPLSVYRLTGDMRLEKGTWELSTARLESHDGIYQVSGRASGTSGLNFTLLRNDERSWILSGTLAKPRLERAGRTQAEVRIPGKQ